MPRTEDMQHGGEMRAPAGVRVGSGIVGRVGLQQLIRFGVAGVDVLDDDALVLPLGIGQELGVPVNLKDPAGGERFDHTEILWRVDVLFQPLGHWQNHLLANPSHRLARLGDLERAAHDGVRHFDQALVANIVVQIVDERPEDALKLGVEEGVRARVEERVVKVERDIDEPVTLAALGQLEHELVNLLAQAQSRRVLSGEQRLETLG
ncbi:hypothetical protein CAOG_009319 [Capsaspora owczarzaki ATCC 30864]|uniref:Uncharacterized protein n=1 Tax=Capsaspora owczarzaki (strain ATCC 30864) TaxID=595528 RepID=A0A0D2VGK4_CAPO3|nr:hypothetical protein CAOG_009319 [Capsaspora owczarzaki ATCC 30864]